jgi:4-hydroxy-2-oxoheptanedioate aldolase
VILAAEAFRQLRFRLTKSRITSSTTRRTIEYGGFMEMKRRDVLGAGMALGLGAAASGALAQQGGGGGRPAGPGAAPAGGGFGGGLRMGPIDTPHVQPSSVDMNYKPRRINKAIELMEDGQPMYYTGGGMGPGVDSYGQGVRMSQTFADAVFIEMEHGGLDFMGLREFLRGLVDGGPTRSGHRTPAVVVTPPIIGLDATYMRANTWVLEQLLDTGIHGIHICHARDTEAIKVASQMGARYPFPRPGINLEMRGLRGSSAGYAAQIWGVNGNMYNHLADLWPLNPKGEIMFGVKIEDTFADQDVATTLALPGVGFAEWGPGDHSYWLYGLDIMPENGPIAGESEGLVTRPEMVKVRQAVLDNCKKNKVMFLNATNADPNSTDYVINQIKDGCMVCAGGEAASIVGREYTKRKMPV